MIIYKATNIINKKVYIGKTIGKLDRRKRDHEKASGNPKYYFHYALRKYGMNNFKWIILYRCTNLDSLNRKEKKIIQIYNSNNQNYGYNITNGGEGGDTYTNNPRKEEILAAIIKERNTEVAKLRVSRVHKGKIVSEEVRRKQSKRVKGTGNPIYGKQRSEEVKEKIRQKNLGRIVPRELVERIAKSNTGKKHTEKTKEKMRKKRCIYLYNLISPKGLIYYTDNLKQFCKENSILGIKWEGMLCAIKDCRKYKNWIVSRELKIHSYLIVK